MKKRSYRVKIYLIKPELDALTEKAQKAGLSRQAFIRRVLSGAGVKEAMPAELPLLIQAVRHTGCSIDQLLKRAEAIGKGDVSRLQKALKDNRAVERLIVDTYSTREPD